MLAHKLSHVYPSCVLIHRVQPPELKSLLHCFICDLPIATVLALQLKMLAAQLALYCAG